MLGKTPAYCKPHGSYCTGQIVQNHAQNSSRGAVNYLPNCQSENCRMLYWTFQVSSTELVLPLNITAYGRSCLRGQRILGRDHCSILCRSSYRSSAMASAATMREEFLELLASRRTASVPLKVVQSRPVNNPMYQTDFVPAFCEAMAACPRNTIHDSEDAFVEENFYVTTEAGEQGHLPVLLLQLKNGKEKRKPAVVCLHSSYKCKEWLRPLLKAYASRGYVAVAVDSRYHGERASIKTAYRDALVSAWKTGETMPFIFDTVWDLIKLMDYLSTRDDIAPSFIGITGESLGGMHAWFAAVAEPRYSVIVPVIGVQNFQWAIQNNKWHARVASVQNVFEEAKMDLNRAEIDAEVVEMVWKRIAPGLSGCFDAPFSIPSIVPRPLLILNGEEDPRCPVKGLHEIISSTEELYRLADLPERFKFVAEHGIGHCMTPFMVKEASNWFDKFLMNEWIRCSKD